MASTRILTCFLFTSFLVCTFLVKFGESQAEVIVEAGDLGKIKGFRFYTNRITKPYYNFGGVPYGVPTNGDRRFKQAEVLTGPLTGDGSPYIANKWGKICPQNSLFPETSERLTGEESMLRALLDHPSSYLNRSMFGIPEDHEYLQSSPRSMGNEDCLHLHINTPRLPTTNPPDPSELMPVIVYVHGGSFMSFWSSLFNGGRLLNHDVLLIPINYRLGVLGFYNLGIDDAPGNAGLYDLVTALEWIQKYIAYFGGDPNRVTITGQSAGAAAVTHLMASQLGAGLFQNVIACSGVAFQEWAITSSENAIKNSLIISEMVGCYDRESIPEEDLTIADKQEIVACMQQAEERYLVANLTEFRYEDRRNLGLGFHAGCPSIQASPDLTDLTKKIIPEDPLVVFQEGRQLPNINLMVGTTRHDGSFVLQEAYDDYLVPNDLENNSTYIRSQLLADILKILGMEDKSYGVVQALADTFIGDAKYSDKLEPLYPGLIDMFSVFFYKAFGYRNVEYNAQLEPKSKNYLFSFDHKGIWSLHALVNFRGPLKGGVSHTDDQIYLFQWFPFFNEKDINVATRWVNNWVNFAKYGNPNGPDDEDFEDDLWPPFPRYLQIGKYSDYQVGDTARDFYRDDWKGISYDLYPKETATTTRDEISTIEDVTGSTTTTTAAPPPQTTSNAFSAIYKNKIKLLLFSILFIQAMLMIV